MNKFLRHIIIGVIACLSCFHSLSQVGVGVTYGLDIYQHHINPWDIDNSGQRDAGSALFNLNIGPKIWIGGKSLSLGLEGQVGIAPFSFDVNEYKGLGAFYFPLMASVNFRGLSGFSSEGTWGFGIAGGVQYTRTDLYFLKDTEDELIRGLFPTYFGQINIGLGSQASSIYLYVRYGRGDQRSQSFHLGVMFDQNLLLRNKLKKTEVK